MSSDVRTWLEADNGGLVHGGEYLRAIFRVESRGKGAVLLTLATVRLVGELTVCEAYINAGPLLGPKNNVYGAGRRLGASQTRRKSSAGSKYRSFPILEGLSTVLAADLPLADNTPHSFEWILSIPVETIPAFQGQCAALKYRLVAEAQISVSDATGTRNALIAVEQDITILHPFMRQPPTRDVPPPFVRFVFADGGQRAADFMKLRAYSRQMEPRPSVSEESVWRRYCVEGILPASVRDLEKYPLHPLNDRVCVSDEPPPSVSDMFHVLALDSYACTFDLRLGNVVVAHVRINKKHFRIGEELVCIAHFPPSETAVFQMKAQLVCTENIGPAFQLLPTRPRLEQVYRRYEAICWMHRQLSFSMSIPSEANPTLYSDLLELHWSLELSFLCSPKTGEPQLADSAMLDSVPSEHRPKSLATCSFSLYVVPCIPISLLLLRRRKQIKSC